MKAMKAMKAMRAIKCYQDTLFQLTRWEGLSFLFQKAKRRLRHIHIRGRVFLNEGFNRILGNDSLYGIHGIHRHPMKTNGQKHTKNPEKRSLS